MNCGTCKFRVDSECHRFPPAVIAEVFSNTVGDGDYREEVESHAVSWWPETDDEAWCGEYQPKE